MVCTGLAARVAMNGWRQHKATWEGAGPRTSVSPTSCAWQWPAHQRFHPQPVLLLTSGDQAMLGRAGVGGPTPTDAPLLSKMPFFGEHHTHSFCQTSVFLLNTIEWGAPYPQMHRFCQICLFPFILNTNRSGPGQQFTASCLKIVLF